MENIVIVEKLCEALQNSDRPTDLGVAIALRVVLDENITLEERYQEEKSKIGKQNVSIISKMATISALETENNKLKQANNILTVEIEQANALIKLYKERNVGNSKAVSLRGDVTVIDSITKLQEFLKPQQTSTQFPANVPTVNISEEEKQKSIYYKSAVRRAKKIWKYLAVSAITKESTRSIVDWNTIFNLLPEERLKYVHVEAACMPKCYGGLGIAVGMKLHDFLFKK